MHLQQTKARSRKSGGPQYYFHELTEPVKEFLRRRGACPVVLQTPYGIAASPFMAVGRDHKLTNSGKTVTGRVGHDRIQQAQASNSIGEAIRYWYGIEGGRDFETIEIDVIIHGDGHFIVVPTAVLIRGAARSRVLEKVIWPLSFHRDHQSKLWRQQIEAVRQSSLDRLVWAASQINLIVAGHREPDAKHILESDLLRAAGALSVLGVQLSPYLGNGYDCVKSEFEFRELPSYPCPIEVKKRSRGFNYQVTRYTKLPRAVVLCMEHNFVNPPEDIDFIELPVLGEYLSH